MKTDYIKRLKINLQGNDKTIFVTLAGQIIAKGYRRIVIGERGPYIEFGPRHIITEAIEIPEGEQWRTNSPLAFYVEFRSICDQRVKVYLQKKSVEYADYKKGLFYISPFALLADGNTLIEPKKRTIPIKRLI